MTELSVSLNFPLRVMIITLLAPTYMEMRHLYGLPLSNEPVNIQLFVIIASYANRTGEQDF